MFSATGNLLKGYSRRPDYITLISYSILSEDLLRKKIIVITKNDSFFNEAGGLPVISSISGPFQIFLGLVHAIVHSIALIFHKKYRLDHFKEATLGLKHIIRGSIYLYPIFGNAINYVNDLTQKDLFQSQAVEDFQKRDKMFAQIGQEYIFKYERGKLTHISQNLSRVPV